MRPPVVRSIEVYCSNPACLTRQQGKTFTVIDTTDMSDAERAELLIEGVDSYKWEDDDDGNSVRIQTSWARERFDGELRDGEVWVCPECRGVA